MVRLDIGQIASSDRILYEVIQELNKDIKLKNYG